MSDRKCVVCDRFIDNEEIDDELAVGSTDKDGTTSFRHTYPCNEPAEDDDPDGDTQ